MNKLLKAILAILLFASGFRTAAQNPLVKMWDKNYGGLADDEPTSFHLTADGGYIIGGFTYSDVGGDKTTALKNSAGVADYWIIKINADGDKQWERDLGGANGDQLYSIIETADGGYLVGGSSASQAGGDKTYPSWGNFDYWIIRLDSSGAILWDKDFGGSASDQLMEVRQTSDGGFLLGGNSASGISGNKSQACMGATDFWVVRTDTAGNLLWEKTFGGTDAEKLFSLEQTTDGGFVLGGASWSPAGGDKTESTWGVDDYWLVKLDSSGNKLWDKDFGGNESDVLYSLKQSNDGGFVLAGRSGSDISGNKTKPLWGGYDYWIIKTDELGNKLNEQCYGGTSNEDEFGNIFQTDDEGYLVSGTSYSSISGNKTESNLGQEQTWILKLDSALDLQWDKTVFTACHDEIGMAVQTADQCYIVVNANGPGCGAGGYRSQPSWNNSRDYWIVKFCDSTYFPPDALAGAMQNLCPGTCTSFQNMSTNAFSYQWNFPGATPDTSTAMNPSNICYSTPGSYDVMLIATNAHKSDTLLLPNFIVVNSYPNPQGITQVGDTLFANPGALSYQWYINGNAISGATDYYFVAIHDGDYNMIATDLNGCEVEAAVFGIVTSVHDAEWAEEFSFYPNPAHNFLLVESAKSITKIIIYDLMGSEVMIVNPSLPAVNDGMQTGVDITALPSAAYFMECHSGDKVYREKFVKE